MFTEVTRESKNTMKSTCVVILDICWLFYFQIWIKSGGTINNGHENMLKLQNQHYLNSGDEFSSKILSSEMTRPLLADDAPANTNTESLIGFDFLKSNRFLLANGQMENDLKLDLKKKYKTVINQIEYMEKKRKVERKVTQRLVDLQGEKLMDQIWNMYKVGRLSDENDVLEKLVSFQALDTQWPVVKKEVQLGSFLEVGGCLVARAVSVRDHVTSTVIAVTQVTDSQDQSFRTTCSSEDGSNLYLAESSVVNLQKYFKDISSDVKVIFSTIYLTNFTILSENLLPHEYIEMLAHVFASGKKILIPNLILTDTQELYFIGQWTTPGNLFHQACEIGGLECNIEVIWGYDAWSNEDSVLSVTVNTGRRTLPRKLCQGLSSSKHCFATFNQSSDNLEVVFDDNKHIVLPVHANETHLETLLELGLHAETRQRLFVKMLQMQHESKGKLYVRGADIVRKHSEFHQEDKKNEKVNQPHSKHRVHPKQAEMPRKENGKTNTMKQANVYGWERETVERGSHKRKIGEGWERENGDRNQESDLPEQRNILSVTGQQDLSDDSERKDMSQEEIEIHRGLDYLQSKDMNKNTSKETHHARLKSKSDKYFINSNNSIEIHNVTTKHPKRNMQVNINSARGAGLDLQVKTQIQKAFHGNQKGKTTKSTADLVKEILKIQLSKSNRTQTFKTFSPQNPSKAKKLLKILKGSELQQNATHKTNMRKLLVFTDSDDLSLGDAYNQYSYTRRKRQRTSQTVPSNKKASVTSNYVTMATEEIIFDGQWVVMKDCFLQVGDVDTEFSVFLYGQKRQALISNKISMLYPHASVVMVFPTVHANLLKDHIKILKALQKSSSLSFIQDLSMLLVKELTEMPELFKFQVLGLDVFGAILKLGDTFPMYLGHILSLAETTFIELPHFDQLELASQILSIGGKKFSANGVISLALSLVGAEAEEIEMLRVMVHEEVHSTMLRIKLKFVQRQVTIGCDNTHGALTLLPDGAVSLHITSTNTYHTVSRATHGIGLNWLLRMGLEAQHRASLFGKYLKLWVHDDMCPAHIAWRDGQLVYARVTDDSGHPVPHTLSDRQGDLEAQVTTELILKEIINGSFSFLDYNSHNNIGFNLASRYPNSTFVSLLADSQKVPQLLHGLNEINISNVVMAVTPLTVKLMTKLMKCPDFLRYQFLDYSEVLRQMKTQARDGFSQFLGQMISTGVTSFIQVPSSKILSLAATTFYPEIAEDFYEHHPLNNSSNLYRSSRHPLPVFKNAGDQFLFENTKADVEIDISAKVVMPQQQPTGAQLPWKLVRVDVRKLKVEVDHHFDFAQDGHTRKYTLHCSSNDTDYSVHLIRGTDGFKIPYGEVNAISLIALLRMGLETSIRDRFYSEFLKLPLYEDMAPWNIVFRAGRLDYIDYDSKDVTFNKVSEAAYQIMAMLMNYKRTVEDFGKCKRKAKTVYGFDIVSECVGSRFSGPCTDIRKPVPCGDHTCKSTYIDCLKALHELELSKDTNLLPTQSTVVPSIQRVKDGYREWSFNIEGPSKTGHR